MRSGFSRISCGSTWDPASAPSQARLLLNSPHAPPTPPPLKHFDYLGFNRYSLRSCTHQRQTLFDSDEAVSLVLTQILRAASEHAFDVIAYCFMPDHVHLLGAGSASDARLPPFSARAKQYSGFHFQARYGVRLWQRYAYERVLRSDESTVDVVRYTGRRDAADPRQSDPQGNCVPSG